MLLCQGSYMEEDMKRIVPIASAALLALSSSAVFAQNVNVRGNVGASANTPGHQMQLKGSVKGTTGASGYAPGHQMQLKGSVKGTTGASGYAPGHIKSNTD